MYTLKQYIWLVELTSFTLYVI